LHSWLWLWLWLWDGGGSWLWLWSSGRHLAHLAATLPSSAILATHHSISTITQLILSSSLASLSHT
jgi:hypothetical protein